MPKYERYQDYVIRDGRLIGEFEQMYRDFDDPWHESTAELFTSDKAAGLNLLARLKAHHGKTRVLEVGCGFGQYTARFRELGFTAVGIDISETAILKARQRHPGIEFAVGGIHDHDLLRLHRPDVIVLAEVTWYVLEQLRPFLEFMRVEMPDACLLHLLNTYPPGVQTYGTEYFTDLQGIKRYIGMRCLESGEVHYEEGGSRTWLLGTWNVDLETAWRKFGDQGGP